MDAIEILGSLLGSKSKGGGRGADILKDIFGGGRSSRAAPNDQAPANQTHTDRRTTQVGRSPVDDNIHADDLEDLLNVAVQRQTQNRPASPTASSRQAESATRAPMPPRSAPAPYQPPPNPIPTQPNSRNASQATPMGSRRSIDANTQALVLVRAMVSAAKADGTVSSDEQQQIFHQLGDQSAETVQFLRGEFAKQLDVRELAWSVPLGLEEQVYSISLIAMKLDTQAEAEYLAELAHGLRLAPEACNRLHARYNAPAIFES